MRRDPPNATSRTRVAGILLAFSGLAATLPAAPPGAESPVLVEIGDERVTLEQLLHYLRQSKPQLDFVRLPAAEQQRLVREYVERRLLAGEARRKGLAGEPEVEARLQFFADGVLGQALRDRLLHGIPVSEGEITAYFETHRAEFVEPPRYLVEHLLYSRPELARSARERLMGGVSWAELRADSGPELLFSQRGWLTPELLLPPMAEAAAALEVGEASGILKTSHGFSVIRLAGREPERPQELAEVRDQIVEQLRRAKSGELLEELLARLEAARPVRLHLDRLPADPP